MRKACFEVLKACFARANSAIATLNSAIAPLNSARQPLNSAIAASISAIARLISANGPLKVCFARRKDPQNPPQPEYLVVKIPAMRRPRTIVNCMERYAARG